MSRIRIGLVVALGVCGIVIIAVVLSKRTVSTTAHAPLTSQAPVGPPPASHLPQVGVPSSARNPETNAAPAAVVSSASDNIVPQSPPPAVQPPAPVAEPTTQNILQVTQNRLDSSPTTTTTQREQRRIVTAEQREKMIAILSPLRGSRITISAESGDLESFQFAEQLTELFMKSGWGVNAVEEATDSVPTPGVCLFAPDQISALKVKAVLNGMRLVAAVCPVTKVGYLEVDELELRVGSNP